MAKISACIISYNEENKIEDCLQSLQGVVDEIILVDSLSDDKTVEIARKYTDRIYDQKFLGYVEQKKLAMSKAHNDWVLNLDCDERLSDDLKSSILTAKANLDKADAYQMARRTFYVYRWLNYCWYPDKKVRLFNRRKAKWGGVNPHGHVEVDTKNIIKLNGDIYHYSFDTISDHLQTIDKFTEIGALEIVKKGKRVTMLAPFTHASWTFIRLYILRRGFLDGFAGIIVAFLSFMHVFIKYCKVIVMQRRKNRD